MKKYRLVSRVTVEREYEIEAESSFAAYELWAFGEFDPPQERELEGEEFHALLDADGLR
jgi:hypothetical protein